MENNNSHSDKSQEIMERFAYEALRGDQAYRKDLPPPRNSEAVSFSDYQTMYQEIIPVDLLPNGKFFNDSVLAKRVAMIWQDSKLKLHFRKGYQCFPAIIPFSNNGIPLSTEEIKNGDYLRTIIKNKEGKTLYGFSGTSSYVGDFLPSEIQGLAFTIQEYDHPEDIDPVSQIDRNIYKVTPEDKKRIVDQYVDAFRKLQKLQGE